MSGSTRRRFTDKEAKALRRRREADESVSALAATADPPCSLVTMWATLKRAGYVQKDILTDAQLDQAQILYEEKLWSLARIGKKYGVSSGTVGNHLVKRRKVILRPRGNKPMPVEKRKIGKITGKTALSLLEKKWPLKKIAKKAGVSFQSVHEALKPHTGE